MPAKITHYLHAKRVLEHLNVNITSKKAFFWGCQGPDFLFFHRAMPWMAGKSLRRLGQTLHRAVPDLLFDSIRKFERENSDETVASYVAGFLCHYALDRTAHPYIYRLQNEIMKDKKIKHHASFVHNEIEYSLDSLMLREILGLTPHEILQDVIFPLDLNILTPQAKFMRHVINDVSVQSVSEKAVLQAFFDMAAVCKFLFDPKYKKRRIFLKLEGILRIGPAISSMIYQNPDNIEFDYINQDGDFLKIFSSAISDAKHLIDAYFSGINLSGLIDGRNFKGEKLETENENGKNS